MKRVVFFLKQGLFCRTKMQQPVQLMGDPEKFIETKTEKKKGHHVLMHDIPTSAYVWNNSQNLRCSKSPVCSK